MVWHCTCPLLLGSVCFFSTRPVSTTIRFLYICLDFVTLVVTTSATDCLEKLVFKMTYCVKWDVKFCSRNYYLYHRGNEIKENCNIHALVFPLELQKGNRCRRKLLQRHGHQIHPCNGHRRTVLSASAAGPIYCT